MRHNRFARALVAGMFVLTATAAGRGQAVPPPPSNVTPATQPADGRHAEGKFLRFVDNGKTGGQLETADVVYRNAAGVKVCLVSAVHIGERTYFQGLNKSFAGYDAVLYELVKPKGAAVPKPAEPRDAPRKSDHTVAQFQRFLNESLGLEYQLDQIDYTKANFIHADLDAQTFQKMQADRGESFATIMLRQMLEAMSRPPQTGQSSEQLLNDLIGLATRPDAQRQLRLFLARQMGTMEEHALGLDGPNGSVIITERNKAAMKVLDDALKGGKKNIAIFYGAAHMPDMSKRLAERGFTRVDTHWRAAWDVTIRADQPSMIEDLLNEFFQQP